jgi:hypothetical protein
MAILAEPTPADIADAGAAAGMIDDLLRLWRGVLRRVFIHD